MILLLAIGIIRLMFLIFFNSVSEQSIHLLIRLMGHEIECDALVDSGNLLKDPIDLRPVMLIKSSIAEKLFPEGIPNSTSNFNGGVDRFVRLIPVSKNGHTTLELGFRPERVAILEKNGYSETKLTFIIDKEEGSFGGFEALVPANALLCI